MSHETVKQLLDRALLDEEFRRTIEADPVSVLEQHDLTEEERSPLLSRNITKMDAVLPIYCTIRFAVVEPVIAYRELPDELQVADLRRRGAEIVNMTGDRTEKLKELLSVMR